MSKKTVLTWLLIFICIVLGSYLRVQSALVAELWLDEQYSLFYAHFFSASQLLFGFSRDIHPGLYYYLLSQVLSYTQNTFWLRFISSTLPQIVAYLLLVVANRKKSPVFLLSATVFVTLNPFFINYAWQLREYSLAFLVSVAVYLVYSRWRTDSTKRWSFLLLLSLLASHFVSYSFYFISFFLVPQLLSDILKQKKGKRGVFPNVVFLKHFIASTLLLTTQFFLQTTSRSFNVQQYQSQFDQISWIEKPNHWNIPSVYLTTLGLDTDYHAQNNTLKYSTLFFYFFILLITYIVLKSMIKRKKLSISYHLALPHLSVSIFPIALMLFISLLLPFLSNRFFFYQFIPNISLFLPRAHLPFVIIGGLVFIHFLLNWFPNYSKNKPILLVSLFICGLFVTYHWTQVNLELITYKPKSEYQQEFQTTFTKNTNVSLIPEWIRYETISPENFSYISQAQIKEEYRLNRELFEKDIVNCNLLTGKTVLSKNEHLTHPMDSNNKLKNVENCCKKEEAGNYFTTWSCN